MSAPYSVQKCHRNCVGFGMGVVGEYAMLPENNYSSGMLNIYPEKRLKIKVFFKTKPDAL